MKNPKLADGKLAVLGTWAWSPGSHDSWAGPHRVKIIGVTLKGDVQIEFADGVECWTAAKNVYGLKPKRK